MTLERAENETAGGLLVAVARLVEEVRLEFERFVLAFDTGDVECGHLASVSTSPARLGSVRPSSLLMSSLM